MGWPAMPAFAALNPQSHVSTPWKAGLPFEVVDYKGHSANTRWLYVKPSFVPLREFDHCLGPRPVGRTGSWSPAAGVPARWARGGNKFPEMGLIGKLELKENTSVRGCKSCNNLLLAELTATNCPPQGGGGLAQGSKNFRHAVPKKKASQKNFQGRPEPSL